MGVSYYDILEVDQKASLAEIKAAWRAKIRIYHTDNKVTGSKAIFLLIQEAYDVLSDDLKRANYDRTLGLGGNTTSTSTSDQPGMWLSTTSIMYGRLNWDQIKTAEFGINYTGLDGSYAIDFDWLDGKKPLWASDFESESVDGGLLNRFSIDPSQVEPGVYKNTIKVILSRDSGRGPVVISEASILVSFEVSAVTNLSVSLDNSSVIRVGPLEVGRDITINATLKNTGNPIWEVPVVGWHGSIPAWATGVKVHQEAGRIFPCNISFYVQTKGLDHTKNPYKAQIEVRLGKQIIGLIPVILTVTKVPVPHVVASPTQLNLGNMAWNEVKTVHLKLDNLGDSPKQMVNCRVENSPYWIRLGGIQPNDTGSFPKSLEITANAISLKEGDYVASLAISDGVNTQKVPVYVRVSARPQVTAKPDKIVLRVRETQKVSFDVELMAVGGDIPTLDIRWHTTDWYTQKPQIMRANWPVMVRAMLIMKGCKTHIYQNSLEFVIGDGQGGILQKILVPVEVHIV